MKAAVALTPRLRTLAENILTLEINTIVSPHIEAEKMPPPEHALIDIANEYRSWLRDRRGRADMWREGEVSEASQDVFRRIRTASNELLESALAHPPSETNLLERMKTNSDQFISIFARLNDNPGKPVLLQRSDENHQPTPVELLPEELVVVRKAWELMLDEVMMQTTIQIDGDVLTRIRRGLIADPDGALLMKLHDKSVSTSTAFWGKLVDILGGALKGLVDLFAGI